MKNKPFLAILTFALIAFDCNKEQITGTRLSDETTSNYSTDGILTAQVSILPPVTPQSFIANAPNGNGSFTAFDLITNRRVYIDYFYMKASYPVVNMLGNVPNQPAETQIPINAYIPNGSYNQSISLLYNNVDSTTSPAVTSCRLDSIAYHTEDWTTYMLPVDGISGGALSMCIVNNIAHINFTSPAEYKELSNGYVEMADVKLSGDTSWTLNALPVNFYYPDFSYGTYPTKLAAVYNGAVVSTAKVVTGHQGVLKFNIPLQHVAGATEEIKIYGYNLKMQLPSYFVTEMGNLQGLSWKDGLGGNITGSLNATYYKEPTGSASLHNY